MASKNQQDTSVIYKIRVRGHLDSRWSDWFDGFEMMICCQDTLLTGSVPDQPALHGVLAKIRDLGLTILLVEKVNLEVEENDEES